MGFRTNRIEARFEGEADFFAAGEFMIFTYGTVERQRFVPRIGIPPWKRVYGFRSEPGARNELEQIVAPRQILPIELINEAHYHGDTVFCSFGKKREFLLAYMQGVATKDRQVLRDRFGANLIELTESDAAIYAANSFQTDIEGKLYIFLPHGVSESLLSNISARDVTPVTVNVSEFLAKGGGSIKCMILDLGPRELQPASGAEFRAARAYQNLFK
jgi:hypothetical protein